MRKKGFLEVEFIISTMVFLSVLVFILISISREWPSFEERAAIEDIKANGYVISRLLLLDEGEPADWETKGYDEIIRVGLSSGEPYRISENKITKLDGLCKSVNGYQSLSRMFNDNSMRISIEYPGAPGGEPVVCGQAKSGGVRFEIRGFGVIEGSDIANVTVTIYGAV